MASVVATTVPSIARPQEEPPDTQRNMAAVVATTAPSIARPQEAGASTARGVEYQHSSGLSFPPDLQRWLQRLLTALCYNGSTPSVSTTHVYLRHWVTHWVRTGELWRMNWNVLPLPSAEEITSNAAPGSQNRCKRKRSNFCKGCRNFFTEEKKTKKRKVEQMTQIKLEMSDTKIARKMLQEVKSKSLQASLSKWLESSKARAGA